MALCGCQDFRVGVMYGFWRAGTRRGTRSEVIQGSAEGKCEGVATQLTYFSKLIDLLSIDPFTTNIKWYNPADTPSARQIASWVPAGK